MGKRIEILFSYKNKGLGKYSKYKIAFQIRYDTIITCWLSDKQLKNVEISFNGFERIFKDRIIYGAFDDSRFMWSDTDATRLCQYFDVSIDTIPDIEKLVWPGTIPILEIPEHVEIADELKDNIT